MRAPDCPSVWIPLLLEAAEAAAVGAVIVAGFLLLLLA